jgi:hypothetical protein
MVSVIISLIAALIAILTIMTVMNVSDEQIEAFICGFWCIAQRLKGRKI